MTILELHIFCKKDERSEEDVRLQKQLEELNLPTPVKPEVVEEWRLGLVVFDHIAFMYHDGNSPENSILHTTGGAAIVVKESLTQIQDMLNQSANK